MDASLRALAQFNDPSKWVVVPAVPVFDTFEMDVPGRPNPDGTPAPGTKVRFDVPELQALCQKANAREAATGDVCPLTLGHTVPGAPETAQPPVVGYARNFRVAPFGPAQRPAATADFWYMREHWGQGYKADEYKRKSVELWFKGQMFDPIALLKSRTPMRDLGLIMAQRGVAPVYQSESAALYPRAGDFKLYYSMESFAMDPTQPPDAAAPDNDFLEKMMKCMRHPQMVECMRGAVHAAMGAPGGAPAAPPAFPGPSAGALPPPMAPHQPPHQPPAPPPPMHHQPMQHQLGEVSPQDMLRMQLEHFENVKVQMQRQQEEMAAIKKDAKQARAEKTAAHLWHQNYDIDVPDFVVRLMRADESAWGNEIDWVRKHCRERQGNPDPVFDEAAHFAAYDHRAPVGGTLLPGLDQRPDAARPDRPLTADETERCFQFIRKHPEWAPDEAMDQALKLVRPSANGVK